MKLHLSLGTVAVILLAVGCIPNRFDENYMPYKSSLTGKFPIVVPQQVEVRPVATEAEVVDAIEEGYITIGTSSFVGEHCPWFKAVDVAENKRAALVLIDEKYHSKEMKRSVIYLPQTRLSYSYGVVASKHGVNPLAGAGVTTTVAPTTHTTQVTLYDQSAMFLQKVDFSDYYGALFYVAPRLPGETMESACKVTLLGVMKGSQAARDGLKRGQRVTSINGAPVRTHREIQQYLDHPRSIRSMGVAQ